MTEAADPWVVRNVLSVVWDCPVPERAWTRRAAGEDLAIFLADDPDPVVVADWPEDIRHLCDLMVVGPGKMAPIPRLTLMLIRLETYPTSLLGAVAHNAWWDAMALKRRMEELGR